MGYLTEASHTIQDIWMGFGFVSPATHFIIIIILIFNDLLDSIVVAWEVKMWLNKKFCFLYKCNIWINSFWCIVFEEIFFFVYNIWGKKTYSNQPSVPSSFFFSKAKLTFFINKNKGEIIICHWYSDINHLHNNVMGKLILYLDQEFINCKKF